MDINDSENQFENGPITIPDERNLVVIVGSNNSGKSTFLRSVNKSFPQDSHRVDVNRTILRGEGAQVKSYFDSRDAYVNENRGRDNDNYENPFQTLQDFFRLKDTERGPIVEWYNKYFPNNIYEEREDIENSASPKLLKVNGHPITEQGSGMRATLEIFIRLLDPSIKILCIDEPELGLEPYMQKFLFRALKDKAAPDKKIIIATHSHHFLDIEEHANNYVCERNDEGRINISEVTDLKSIIFRLLGNTLSSYLLPEKVLIVEGPSDNTFVHKALELLGKPLFAIHGSGGIGNISYAVNSITQFLRFNDNNNPVYKENLFVVVDRPTKDIVVREWRRILEIDEGAGEEKVCVLSKNGIEYFYPERILKEIFNIEESAERIVNDYLASPSNKFNGITKSKTELSKSVAERLTLDDLQDADNELFVFLTQLPAE